MLDRLWGLSSKTEPTIGIDLFENPTGNKVAVVYIPGTQTVGLGEGANPLDMASNIQAISSYGEAASERAVLLAMKQAGIESNDEVILVGHSQGGMVAGNLAAFPSGFVAAGLVAFGAPLAHNKNLKAPVMAIEHVNDPVPNLSGKANPMKKNWVTVQRISEKPESNALMFSHSLKSYRNTTAAIDVSGDVGIKNIKAEIFQKLESAKPGKSLEFVISRESVRP
jgi:pimeloyl-ACP methyl ester carboxylesterase